MFLRLLPPLLVAASPIFAQSAPVHRWCPSGSDLMTDCTEMWVCVGNQGKWVMGTTYASGLFFGSTWDLTLPPDQMEAKSELCEGAWSDAGGGLGSLTFSCGSTMTVTLSLQLTPRANDREFTGAGQADDGRHARAFSGQLVASDIFARMSRHSADWRRVYEGEYSCDPEEEVS